MKTLLLVLAVCTAFSCKLSAQTYLTPRVGNDIDMDEKSYFGLFPSVKGFVSAKATSRANDSTYFTIRSLYHGVVADTTVIVETRTVEKLSKYIEEFESVRNGDNEVKWSMFKGLAQESSVIGHDFHDALGATVTTLDGRSIYGKLFWAEDSTLVLWKSDEPYNWRTVGSDANVIPVNSISTISLDKRFRIRKGPGTIYGGLAGLAMSAVYLVFNYSDYSHSEAKTFSTVMLVPSFIAATAIIGGTIEYLLQPNFQATIDGKEEKYLPILPTLTKASTIDSYPPPELVRLINK